MTTSAPLPKVLMVSLNTPPYVFAGAGNQAVLLSQTLIKNDLHVTLVTGRGESGWASPDTLGTLPVVRLRGSHHPLLNLILFNLLSIIWGLFNAGRFDLIHIHGCTHLSTLVWIVLGKLSGKKTLMKITCSGVDDLDAIQRYPVLGLIAYPLAKLADGFIALTPEIAASLKTHVPKEKIFQVANGYNGQEFYPASADEKQELRSQLGIPTDVTALVYVGGINERKNVHALVETLATLKPEFPDLRLYLVGPCKTKAAGYKENLLARIHKLGLSDTVILTGELPYNDVSRYLKAGDIFVFASSQEGLPSSPIEAMACGLPTVIMDLPGVTDWLYVGAKHPVALITERSTEAFSKNIRELLQDRELQIRMKSDAANYARETFEIATIGQIYQNAIYPALMNRSFGP